ncbi:MAG TPA: hypothetical protein VF505_03165 [Thermoanaerobaculia bacterium]
MTVRRLTLILLLLAIACSSPERKAQKARDELSSWAGVGQMLSQEWSRGKVARPYVKSTLDVAFESLKGLADPLKNDEKAEAELGHVTQLFDGFSRAVEKEDRAAAASLSTEFEAIRKSLQKQ